MKWKLSQYSNIGKLIMLIGFLLLVPLLVLPFYPQDTVCCAAFLIPGLGSVALGVLICLFSKRKTGETAVHTVHHWNLTVLIVWLYGCLAGAIPFVIGGNLTFVQGLFEAVSGWTTTGLSVMDVEATPHIFLFYRSFMQFCGGLGFVMIMLAFIQDRLAMNLYTTEGHSDKIMPTLKETARSICQVYVACLAVGVIAYVVCGMPVFDSLLHAMGALSTGGFSNRADSIGAYGSLPIEAVTIFLMLLGTTNFAVLLLAVHQKWKDFFRSGELRLLGVLLLLFVPLTALSLMSALYIGLGEGLREALFNIVSALSTTGYSTSGYTGWPAFALGVMILMMLIGGGIGSTAGGIKLSRVLILLKATWLHMKSQFSAEHAVSKPYYYRAQGKTAIDSRLVGATSGYIMAYLLIFITGSLLLTVTAGASLTDAMFEFASSLGTVGLSVGLTGPATNNATLLVEIGGMILGRLEIFLVTSSVYSAVYLLRERIRKTRVLRSHN